MRKWQRGRNRRGKGPAPAQESTGVTPLQPIVPQSLPDDIGNRVEPEPSDGPEENFNRYPSQIEQRQRQPQGGGEGGGRRGRRGGRGRPPQGPPPGPRRDVVNPPPAPPASSDQVEPAQGGGAPGGRRRRRKRGGRGRGGERGERGEQPPQISRDASGTGALVPNYPEERFAPAQQPVSEVAPELPAARPAPSPSPSQPVAPEPRKPKGVVVLAIGLPGSGKSSWFKRRGVTPLSSDVLRSLLFDDIAEQRYQDLVFSTLRSLLRARMIARMPWNYVDATNLNPKERHGWIKMAREFHYEVHAVFFDVPLEVCMERNLKRARLVPEEIMQRMANKLRPPTFEEGFSKIIVVRVKRREDEPTSEVQPQPGEESLGEEEEDAGIEEE